MLHLIRKNLSLDDKKISETQIIFEYKCRIYNLSKKNTMLMQHLNPKFRIKLLQGITISSPKNLQFTLGIIYTC